VAKPRPVIWLPRARLVRAAQAAGLIPAFAHVPVPAATITGLAGAPSKGGSQAGTCFPRSGKVQLAVGDGVISSTLYQAPGCGPSRSHPGLLGGTDEEP
jgi:hypothetical protein